MVRLQQRTGFDRKKTKTDIIFLTDLNLRIEVPVGSTIHTIGEINGYPAKTYAIHIPVSGDETVHAMMKDLRASFDVLPLEEYKRGGKASQILNWDKNSRYCPMCGVPTVQVFPHSQTMSGMPAGVLSAYFSGGHCTY